MKKTLLTISLLIFTLVSNSQNALHFDGTNDYVQTTFPGVLGTTNRTFEAWIYLDVTPTANRCIMDYGRNAVYSRNTFGVNANRSLVYLSGGNNIASNTNVVPVGTWSHVAFVLNSGTGYFYVNGVQVGSGPLPLVNTPSGYDNLRIGERVSGGTIPFPGIIDEVRVWDIARTTAQIAADTAVEICLLQTNLKAYYRFNEGVAGGTNTGVTSVIDYAGSNNGTFSGLGLTGLTSNYVTGKGLTRGYDKTTFKDSTCGPYTTTSGTVYTATGVYYDTLTNSTSCDSLIEYDINISSVDDSVYRTGGRIDSWDAFANHQWVRCDNNFAPIAGATNRFYTATVTGDYAVIVSRGACVDTSECINISMTSINKNESDKFVVFPNPALDIITIKSTDNISILNLTILDVSGKVIVENPSAHIFPRKI
ncbi:hypothetical protein N9Q26_00365 [bacterium]|nr:hypothetical protein [bacterium]